MSFQIHLILLHNPVLLMFEMNHGLKTIKYGDTLHMVLWEKSAAFKRSTFERYLLYLNLDLNSIN